VRCAFRRPARSGRTPTPRWILGTNNCRLLIATPAGGSFRVIDAYSRVVRWARAWARPGVSEAAMDRRCGARGLRGEGAAA
jgi:exopolyphosphatase/guanosine-5'-triphosphate,3'-diphosphate pyrophosphatase